MSWLGITGMPQDGMGMTTDPAAELLRSAWRALQDQWRATEAMWDDAVRAEFEKEYWAEFESIVPSTFKQTDQLLDLIEAARRELGD